MKTHSFFTTVILLAATSFTSCGVNDDIHENAAVRFTANIGGQAAGESRASGTAWTDGDAIGIFMVANGTTAIAGNALDMQYATTGDGTFTAVAGNEIYYPMDGSPVDFIAYYPYGPGATLAAPIDITIGDQADQSAFDLLYAAVDNGGSGYTKEYAGNIALAFTHKLAKIVMNCTADANVGEPLTGMRTKIKGMNTVNTFDLATGTLGTASAPADIIPRTVTDGSVYDAIIMPGSYADSVVMVEFAINPSANPEIFTWILDAAKAAFEGGNEYTYNVTITRTGIEVTGTINPWITNDRDGITAE